MGQQQLLLIVLSIIIVGIAVVVGIEMFQQPTIESELVSGDSAFYADLDAICDQAILVFGQDSTFSRLTADSPGMLELAYPVSDGIFENRNGIFRISVGGNDRMVQISGVAKRYLNPANREPLSVDVEIFSDGRRYPDVNSPASSYFYERLPQPGIPGQVIPENP